MGVWHRDHPSLVHAVDDRSLEIHPDHFDQVITNLAAAFRDFEASKLALRESDPRRELGQADAVVAVLALLVDPDHEAAARNRVGRWRVALRVHLEPEPGIVPLFQVVVGDVDRVEAGLERPVERAGAVVKLRQPTLS